MKLYLCAQCYMTYREQLHLRESKEKKDKGECMMCHRKCYGATYEASIRRGKRG